MVLKKSGEIKKIIDSLGPRLINKIKIAHKIADIGCAEGELLKVLYRQFKKPQENLYGFEINTQFMARAKKLFPHIYQADFSRRQAAKRAFDLVFCLDVVEHVEKPNLLLANLAGWLKKDGFLVLATPNPDSLSHFLMGSRWFGFKDKTHRRFYRLLDLRRLLEKQGLKVAMAKSISCSGNNLYDRLISFLGLGGEIILLAQKNED